MRFLRRMLNGERGQALPMALILLALGGFLVVPTLALMTTNLTANRVVDEANLAFYAADAGIEDAYWKLGQETVPSFPYTLTDPINGRTVELSEAKAQQINGNTTTYTIKSTAKLGGETKDKIVAEIQRTSAPNFVFDHAVTAVGGDVTYDISATGSVTITSSGSGGTDQGDIYAAGNIKFTGTADISGTATATGTISGIPPAQSDPNAFPIDYTPSIDLLDLSVYKLPEGVGTVHSGNYNISGSSPMTVNGPIHITDSLNISGSGTVTLNGPIHVHNDFSISGSGHVILNGDLYVDDDIMISGSQPFTGSGNLVAGDKVDISGSVAFDPNDIPLIASANGNIDCSGSGVTANLYAPNGSITLSGSGTVYGALFAESVKLTGSVTVNYPTDAYQGQTMPGSISVQLKKYSGY